MKKFALIFSVLFLAVNAAGCNTSEIREHDKDVTEVVSEVSSDVSSESDKENSEQVQSVFESDTVTSEIESDSSNSNSSESSDLDWDTLFKNIQSTTDFVNSFNENFGKSSSPSDVSSKNSSEAASSSSVSSTAVSSSAIPASDEQIKSMAEKYLSNKYMGTWAADSVINRAYLDETRALTSAYRTGGVYDEFRFCVVTKYYGGDEYKMIDNYVEANSRNSIGNSFQKMLLGEKTAVDSGVFLDFGYPDLEASINIYGESNPFLDSHEFVEKWNVESFYFQVFVSDSEWTEDSLDSIVKVAENVSHSYDGIKIAVGIHYVDDLTSVKDSLHEQVSVGDEYLNNHGRKRESIVFGVRNGVRDDSCIDEILN